MSALNIENRLSGMGVMMDAVDATASKVMQAQQVVLETNATFAAAAYSRVMDRSLNYHR